MPRRGTIALALGVAALTATVAIARAGSAGAADTPVRIAAKGKSFTAQTLTPTAIRSGTKDGAFDGARTDPSLLGQRGSNLVSVVVRLKYAPVASYRGNLKGLRATSPRVTGHALNRRSAAVRAYGRYIARREASFKAALAARVPAAKAGRALRFVYGGIALRVPANKVADVLRLPGVTAVQRDTLQQPRTDAVSSFIGATKVTREIGGVNGTAGEGTILADLDTGIWPEHPSFVDHGNLTPAPASATPRPCLFGDNPLTPANDPFVCDNKVIGGRPFLDTYHAVVGDESFPGTARDSEGHGTHTASTAAGGPVASAPIFGIERGPLTGVAPGAHILSYKVCGTAGCFASDSVAAVEQAIIDGADVINFSIGGGNSGAPDPVDLAFLDAYNAGVLVSASGGNSGPGAGTVEHFWPWYMTVAASTQRRQFQSTLTVSGDGQTLSLVGSSVTHGVTSATPIVNAGAVTGYTGGNLCETPAAPGTFTGKIVICTRGVIGRAQKGFNVSAGNAAGMVLANVAPGPTMSDNHFLPTVHLESPAGTKLQAFLVAHPNSTATFTDGVKGVGQGDRMTEFSSRGPGGLYLKPDVTAPGIQILAGNTPVPDDVAGGPPGEYFQAIAGTSMSAPVNAGAALLLLALNPAWSPGQVKSALMTTATTKVVKEDGATPADSLDFGSGRIDLRQAGHPGLTISETAANFAAHSQDPNAAIDLNIPSINAPVMPGIVQVERTVKNASGRTLRYRTSGASGRGWRISVTPRSFRIRPGQSVTLKVTIDGREAEVGVQQLASIRLRQTTSRTIARSLHVPVAFNRTQGGVSLAVKCAPTSIARGEDGACDVDVQNNTLVPADVASTTRVSRQLRITGTTGATQDGFQQATASATLAGREPSMPTVAAGESPAGFLDLADFGIIPTPIGDEDVVDFGVPEFVYGDGKATAISVSSNGWLAVGGTTAGATFIPQVMPDPAEPNNTLAPFWTDLDGTNAPGLRAGTLTDGVNSWLVVQWDTAVFGATTADPPVRMQAWIGLNGTQDISFAYDPANVPVRGPLGGDLIVGAENDEGSRGSNLGLNVAPTTDIVVTSTAGVPGEVLHYQVRYRGHRSGAATVTTLMDTPSVRGTTADLQHITVRRN
jgi:hypothetical protein